MFVYATLIVRYVSILESRGLEFTGIDSDFISVIHSYGINTIVIVVPRP